MELNSYKFLNQMIIVFLVVLIAIVFINPIGHRVGDGMEYYAMLLSFVNFGVPYSTDANFVLYDQYISQTKSLGFLSSEYLKNAFLILQSSAGQEYPHFWFYSLLAAPFGFILNMLGLDIGFSFTFLHLILLIVALYVTYKEYGKPAVLAILLLILLSPAIWFINKAHTEFFTIMMSIVGILYFMKFKYLQAAFFFALISTQNPPFAIISFILIIFTIANMRIKFFNYRILLFSFFIGFLVILHPLYYYISLGVITPQFLLGAANDSVTFHRMATWFIDPDVGLFFNWPLGLFILIVGVYLWFKRNDDLKSSIPILLFYLLYVLILSYAQSKTGNLNHGATVYISRYSLWYIALFSPIVIYLIQLLFTIKLSSCKKSLLFISVLVFSIVNISQYKPTKNENYSNQTWQSKYFYKVFSSVWEPEPEIFVERAINKEGIPNHWAIYRDNKILINKKVLQELNPNAVPEIFNNTSINSLSVYQKAISTKSMNSFFYIYGPFDQNEGFLQDYKAKIELIDELNIPFSTNNQLKIHFKVTNIGIATWPTKEENGKNVFLSYHIAKENGSVVIADGLRTSFPHDISSGVSIPLELVVDCSTLEKGKYLLVVDLVHEQLTWFGSKNSGNILSVPIIKF